MSYVDVLILRHLAQSPAHGYQLRKHVEADTGFVLHNNSLYPALRRMEEAGAVVKTAQMQQKRPPRHVYEITDVGREMLHEMLAELPPEIAGDQAEFLCRLAHFALLEPSERLGVLDARDAAVLARMAHLRSLDEGARDDQWGSLVTQELIRRCESERSWLQEMRMLAKADT
ncbi:PadR family transcriptional regulator [Sphaerisporangium fuscum]|uniref:PadR family transcriptional regulator n=1 Tax=Sphaerisporangium fuscum TaxID=2835868 RepID=UPI001BDDAD99|nr:PadR family transcriptional regulator [Sphaerisporangium fuscum]